MKAGQTYSSQYSILMIANYYINLRKLASKHFNIMPSHTVTTDQQILNYLGYLSEKKKKAVLSVVKTFAEETITLWDLMPDEVRRYLDISIQQSKKGIGRSNE